jgi:hypothetical protein
MTHAPDAYPTPEFGKFVDDWAIPPQFASKIVGVFKMAPHRTKLIMSANIRYRTNKSAKRADLALVAKLRKRLGGGTSATVLIRDIEAHLERQTVESEEIARFYRAASGTKDFALASVVTGLADVWEDWKFDEVASANASYCPIRGNRQTKFVLFVEGAIRSGACSGWMRPRGLNLGSIINRILEQRQKRWAE